MSPEEDITQIEVLPLLTVTESIMFRKINEQQRGKLISLQNKRLEIKSKIIDFHLDRKLKQADNDLKIVEKGEYTKEFKQVEDFYCRISQDKRIKKMTSKQIQQGIGVSNQSFSTTINNNIKNKKKKNNNNKTMASLKSTTMLENTHLKEVKSNKSKEIENMELNRTASVNEAYQRGFQACNVSTRGFQPDIGVLNTTKEVMCDKVEKKSPQLEQDITRGFQPNIGVLDDIKRVPNEKEVEKSPQLEEAIEEDMIKIMKEEASKRTLIDKIIIDLQDDLKRPEIIKAYEGFNLQFNFDELRKKEEKWAEDFEYDFTHNINYIKDCIIRGGYKSIVSISEEKKKCLGEYTKEEFDKSLMDFFKEEDIKQESEKEKNNNQQQKAFNQSFVEKYNQDLIEELNKTLDVSSKKKRKKKKNKH